MNAAIAEARARADALAVEVDELRRRESDAETKLKAMWATFDHKAPLAPVTAARNELLELTAIVSKRVEALDHARAELGGLLLEERRATYAARAGAVGLAGWAAAHADDIARLAALDAEKRTIAARILADVDSHNVGLAEVEQEADADGFERPERADYLTAGRAIAHAYACPEGVRFWTTTREEQDRIAAPLAAALYARLLDHVAGKYAGDAWQKRPLAARHDLLRVRLELETSARLNEPRLFSDLEVDVLQRAIAGIFAVELAEDEKRKDAERRTRSKGEPIEDLSSPHPL